MITLDERLKDPENYWLGAFHIFDWNLLEIQHLVKEFEADPLKMHSATGVVASPEVSLSTRMFYIQALARVGGQFAAEILFGIVYSNNTEWRLRVRALVMLGFCDDLTEESLDELHNLTRRGLGPDAPEEVRNSALLAFGTQIQKICRDIEGSEDRWFEVIEAVCNLPEFAHSSVSVFAMANTRLPQAAEYLYRALEDQDPQRRYDVAAVLQIFPGPRTRDHLRKAMALEDDPEIRKRLEKSLRAIL
ncbi:MAG: HEAT repeat domain-containing protein [Candidatus Cloacimonetes bacterium]|nr:HEAT repeat domain-containing protein [Candidatus Cloacimonadota bacterium]